MWDHAPEEKQQQMATVPTNGTRRKKDPSDISDERLDCPRKPQRSAFTWPCQDADLRGTLSSREATKQLCDRRPWPHSSRAAKAMGLGGLLQPGSQTGAGRACRLESQSGAARVSLQSVKNETNNIYEAQMGASCVLGDLPFSPELPNTVSYHQSYKGEA